MDSLPKVTLLGSPGNTFVLVYGAKMFEFEAGKSRRVPVPIALLARKKQDRKGNPLFKIADMPEIVRPTPVGASKENPKGSKRQNVTARTSQGTLEI
jgi:hypothetical protein